MDGKPLVGAMAQPPELDFVDSWDQIPGDCAMHPDNARVDPVDAHEAMQQLVDLGYIDELDTDKEKAVANAVRELRYNLARDYIGANRPADAIPLLEDLWHQWPEENRFGLKLFNCHLSQNRTAQARTTLEQIIASKKQAATQAQAELKDLSEDLKDKPPEEITPDQHRRVRKLQARASVNLETFAFLWGSLLHVEGDYDGAVTELEKAKTAQMHNLPSLYLKIAEVYLAKGDWRQAEGHFSYVLELDPVNPAAHLGRCRSYLKQGHNPQALEEAMASIGLIYHDPQAHFFCGVALNRCDRPHDALKALQTTISQNPVFPAAHRYLARLYTRRFQDLEQATHHRKLAQESRQRILAYRQAGRPATVDTVATGIAWQITEASNRFPTAPLQDSVVIVSGLPRSGTSMMMQMLAAGGLPILTDQVRGADENNPKGYFELEKVKLLATDRDWIAQAQGQGVKVIAQLLPQLPQGYPYRIIFMQRHLSEVIASQTKMLQRLERKGGNLSPDKLAQTFIRQLDEVQQVLSHYENIGVLYLSYQMVLDDPSTAAAQVNQFLDGSLDPGAMVGAIVPSLHRERATVSP
jgi:tetratricopeptide (TPR) repeat protein